MYYYYAVTQQKTLDDGLLYAQNIGQNSTRINTLKYFTRRKMAILNLIELTEEEYNELKRDNEGNPDAYTEMI